MSMQRVYIAAPFTSKMANKKHGFYGEIVDDKYKNFLETIESVVKNEGFSTILPHRDLTSWGAMPNVNIHEITKKYFDEIDSSDIFIAYPEKGRGTHVELGWAIARKKRIILLFEEDFYLGTMIPGLGAVADIDIIQFKDIPDLKIKLRECLKRIKDSND